jgi:hypothetical protein
MSWIARIFKGTIDKEISRIEKRSSLAKKAVADETNKVYRIERILETDKGIAELKKEIMGAKSIKRRFACHIKGLIGHANAIREAFYPKNKDIRDAIAGMQFELDMIKKYWNDVFAGLDTGEITRVLPVYLKLLRSLRARIEIIRKTELKVKAQIQAVPGKPAKAAA